VDRRGMYNEIDKELLRVADTLDDISE
jgi:hypothetical protein